MSYNFLPCDRNQTYLLPPSLTDWLPEDHLATSSDGISWSKQGAVLGYVINMERLSYGNILNDIHLAAPGFFHEHGEAHGTDQG